MLSRKLNRCISACLLLSFLCSGSVACGQFEAKSGSIHASGQHELKFEPQKLRLMLTIRAEGADAKSAIESLLAHKEGVKKELLAMKAEEASIDFGATQLSSGVPGMSAQMMRYGPQMIAQISRASNGDPADVPKVYIAVSRVQAEWPLPTTDADALALLPETLKEQVKERDLMGEKNKAQLDGPQQEKLEEMQAAMQENMGYYSSEEETSPVIVLFVAKVDDEQRKEGIKAAYERAVAQAKMLAGVTGKQLGDLVSLRTSDLPSAGPDNLASMYNVSYTAYAALAADQMSGAISNEALNLSPSELKLIVHVDAEFALAK